MNSLFRPAKPQINQNSSTGIDKMIESIESMINTKIQMDNQKYQESLRTMQAEERAKEQQRFNFQYDELAKVWGEDGLKQFRDMGFAPEAANTYMRERFLRDFVKQHEGGFTMADVEANSSKLSGEAYKALMSAATDNPAHARPQTEADVNTWLYQAKPNTYAEFTQMLVDVGLEPTKYKAMWDEYDQQRRRGAELSVSPQTEADVNTWLYQAKPNTYAEFTQLLVDVGLEPTKYKAMWDEYEQHRRRGAELSVSPQPKSVKQNATLAGATYLRDIFSQFGLDVTKVPLDDYNPHHMQKSLSAIQTLQANVTQAEAALPPRAHRGYSITLARDGETIILKKGDTTINVTRKGKVLAFKDDKYVRPINLSPTELETVNALKASGYEKIERLYRARINYRVGVTNEYNRLKGNSSLVSDIEGMY